MRHAVTRALVLIVTVPVLVSTACSYPGGTRAVSTDRSSGNLSVVVTGDSDTVDSVPHCQWPLTVVGSAPGAQVGLVRCYVKALAQNSLNDLVPLISAGNGFPVTLTEADLVHARDAASGTATATFETNSSDAFDASVSLRYADGVQAALGMDAMNVDEPASHSWRLVNIGSASIYGSATPPEPSG
ncbi:MAG TPA: hypothetical protein VHS58_12425 [Acetobacteraceae bacterium]|nr:hypothetical protein [Acetobacteraceae bacterium]